MGKLATEILAALENDHEVLFRKDPTGAVVIKATGYSTNQTFSRSKEWWIDLSVLTESILGPDYLLGGAVAQVSHGLNDWIPLTPKEGR